MKTPLNTKKAIRVFNSAIFGLVLVAFAMSMIGCSKGDSRSANMGGYPYNHGGYNNPGYNSANSLSAAGMDSSGSIEMIMSFSSLNAPMYHYTTGQVMGQGELILHQNLNCGSGSIPVGRYGLTAVQPGYAQNGVIQIQMQGPTGPVSLYTTIIDPAPQPKLTSSTGMNGLDELNGTLNLCGRSIYIFGR